PADQQGNRGDHEHRGRYTTRDLLELLQAADARERGEVIVFGRLQAASRAQDRRLLVDQSVEVLGPLRNGGDVNGVPASVLDLREMVVEGRDRDRDEVVGAAAEKSALVLEDPHDFVGATVQSEDLADGVVLRPE